jgi:hypothetical protein
LRDETTGGGVSRHFDDLDAVLEFATLDAGLTKAHAMPSQTTEMALIMTTVA